MNFRVRDATESDSQAIRDIILSAFGTEQGEEIADLVATLLTDPSAQPLLSLVAVADEKVVGHILFSNARIDGDTTQTRARIIAPLTVDPDYQNHGVGARLIRDGLTRAKAAGVDLVFVLGHPGYYPRHGFVTAGDQGFVAPYPIAPENRAAWMVQALTSNAIANAAGKVIVADTLDHPRHWQE